MTEAEIKSRVLERLDDATGSLRYTDAALSEYILAGARLFVVKTGCVFGETTITQVAQQLFYDLPCDLVQVERVWWNGTDTDHPLAPTSPRELDVSFYKWQRQYDTRSRGYFIHGMDQIALWPLATTGGQTYTVQYRKEVCDDITVVPYQYHEALVDYATMRCLAADLKANEAFAEWTNFNDKVARATARRGNADRGW